MESVLRWLAGWKGIELEPGTTLKLELSSWPSGGLGLLVLLGALAALAMVVAVYRRDGQNLSRGKRMWLAGLRCAAILLALGVLLEPNLVAVKREERPGHSILMIDTSQSMGHRDAFRREQVSDLERAWRDLGVAAPGQSTRLELATAMLAHDEQRILDRLSAKNTVRAYRFGAAIDPVPEALIESTSEDAETVAPFRLDLEPLEPDGRYTNLGGALRMALERSREAAIASVIVLSDGRRNLGPQGAEIARILGQRKVPHTFVLGIGDPSETQTIDLTRVEAPEKVFQKDPFRISAHLATQGYERGNASVRLLRVVAGVASPIETKMVAVGGDRPEASVDFEQLESSEPGTFTYRVEVEPPNGEPIDPDRHVAHTQIEVLGEQTRVLVISGGPSHEFRILRHALTRDKTIEVSCWLQSADDDFPQDGNVSIDELPADRAELDPYDVVLLMDPDSSRLTPEFCEMLATHVVEDGAGVWWVCGEKYTLDAIREDASTKVLADLLPVVPDLIEADRRVIGFGHAFDRAWPYALTPEGEESKVTRLIAAREPNAALWGRLPGYHFAFPVQRAKPLATTLVKLTKPDLTRSQEAMPLVAFQFVGAGRVMFSGSDEFYRWRSIDQAAYDKLWVKGVRFLFEGRLSAGDSRLRIHLSEERVELGEPVTVTVTAKDESFEPLARESFEVSFAAAESPAETVRLRAVENTPGEFRGVLRPLSTGFYTVAPANRAGRDTEVSFQVVPAAIEREGPVDLTELQAVASVAGGELFATPQELLAALDRIPSMRATDTFKTPHAIWDTWVTLLLILTVLSLEWWFRKWFNLL